jgi:hypothetical protein
LHERAADQHARLDQDDRAQAEQDRADTRGSGWMRRWLTTREPGSAGQGATASELLAKPDPGVVLALHQLERMSMQILWMVLATLVLVAAGVLALALATRLAAKVRRS